MNFINKTFYPLSHIILYLLIMELKSYERLF
jgi:hypothetical protein